MKDLVIKFTASWTGRVGGYLDCWYPMYFRLTRHEYMIALFDKVGADEAVEWCMSRLSGYVITVEKMKETL